MKAAVTTGTVVGAGKVVVLLLRLRDKIREILAHIVIWSRLVCDQFQS